MGQLGVAADDTPRAIAISHLPRERTSCKRWQRLDKASTTTMMPFVRCDGGVHFAELLAAPAGVGQPAGARAGRNGRVALLVIHALGTSHRIYDGVLDALGWPGPVLRYDLRGHGASEVGEQPYSVAGLARDASQLLDHFGLESVVACGLSVGGLVAQELALSERRVCAAILCGTAARIGTLAGWQARMEQVRAQGTAGLAEAVLARWFSAAFRAQQPDVVRGCRCLLERTPTAGYLAMVQALAAADLTERVRGIRVPALVISGGLDEAATPADGERLAGLIPGARFELLPEASHLLTVEQPLETARLIGSFARGLGIG